MADGGGHHLLRLGLAELAQQRPERGRGAGLHHHGPLPLVVGPDLLDGILRSGQELSSVGDGQAAGVVELDTVFPPGEEGHAEVLFQVLHGAGDGRGGEVKRLRHPAQRPQLGEGGELLEFIEVHHGETLLTFQNLKSGLRYR